MSLDELREANCAMDMYDEIVEKAIKRKQQEQRAKLPRKRSR